ncbi:MAG TPA: GNAT family N-acetyltransferase [Dehalococcoidia bacterium]|jgi:hypothetical protein|nr:GNAT family N-acetyltransferase [Dehalococcoidia bacterium]
MSTKVQYSYRPLVSSSDPAFDRFFEIYLESMPLRERKPKSQIAAMTARHDYRILLLEGDGAVIGFSMVFAPASESFCLLEYMAMHQAHRNLGLGKELFLRTFHSISETVHGLLEVDSDREQSTDQEIRRRRQNFYRRLGCLRIDGLPYELPLPGEGPPPKMDLLLYRSDRSRTVMKHDLEHWLKVVYHQVYDCSPDDPRIVRMLEGVDDPVRLV